MTKFVRYGIGVALVGLAGGLVACSTQSNEARGDQRVTAVPVAALPEFEGQLDDPNPLPEGRELSPTIVRRHRYGSADTGRDLLPA